MNTEKKKSKGIALGILSAIGLWIAGHLLSGKLSFIEDIELYPTGYLVLAFPFVAAAALILAAKYFSKVGKSYYPAFVIAFVTPVACLALSFLLILFEQSNPVVGVISFVLALLMAPLFSIISQYDALLGYYVDGIKLILLYAAYFVPILVGLAVSIKIYLSTKRKKVE